jgi:hypothetical protein
VDSLNNFKGFSFPKLEEALRTGAVSISVYLTIYGQRCASIIPTHYPEGENIYENDDFMHVLRLAEKQYPYCNKPSQAKMKVRNRQNASRLDWWMTTGGIVSFSHDGTSIRAELSCGDADPLRTEPVESLLDGLTKLEAALSAIYQAASAK